MYDWFEVNGYGDEVIEPVDVRFLCEQDAIILRPFQMYYFTIDENCEKCVDLAKHYGY